MNSCWVAARALHQILKTAENALPDETGGVLMGYWHNGEPAITDVVGPGPHATHRPAGFHPDAAWQRREVARLYELSARRHCYLGDWHTHPDGGTSPSKLDRLTLRSIAMDPEARAPRPIMLIAAGGGRWDVLVWQCRPSTLFGIQVPSPLHPLSVRPFG